MSKTKFNHLLLSITFNDKFWRSQLDHHEKKIQFKQNFATTTRPLTENIMVLVYQSTILTHFTMLAPAGNIDFKLYMPFCLLVTNSKRSLDKVNVANKAFVVNYGHQNDTCYNVVLRLDFFLRFWQISFLLFLFLMFMRQTKDSSRYHPRFEQQFL